MLCRIKSYVKLEFIDRGYCRKRKYWNRNLTEVVKKSEISRRETAAELKSIMYQYWYWLASVLNNRRALSPCPLGASYIAFYHARADTKKMRDVNYKRTDTHEGPTTVHIFLCELRQHYGVKIANSPSRKFSFYNSIKIIFFFLFRNNTPF